MNTIGNNLSNYIKSLETALQAVREGTDNPVDIKRVFDELDDCNKKAQFLLSDDKFPYEYSSGVCENAPGIMQIKRIEADIYYFVLDKLLPHRLDYHKLSYKTAAKINHSYSMKFERDIFDFINSTEFKRYDDNEKVCVTFVNCYASDDNNEWDVDNLDVKVFIDFVVSGKFIKDDDHKHLSFCMLTKESDYTHTEVFLSPQEKLDSILKLIYT